MATTAEYREALAADGAELPKLLLEIRHDELPDPLYFVRDNADFTHNGQVYIAVWFQFSAPKKTEQEVPRAVISIDRVEDELVAFISRSGGARGTQLTFKEVLSSDPDTVQSEVTLIATKLVYGSDSITAELSLDVDLRLAAVAVRYEPATAPGLFA